MNWNAGSVSKRAFSYRAKFNCCFRDIYLMQSENSSMDSSWDSNQDFEHGLLLLITRGYKF